MKNPYRVWYWLRIKFPPKIFENPEKDPWGSVEGSLRILIRIFSKFPQKIFKDPLWIFTGTLQRFLHFDFTWIFVRSSKDPQAVLKDLCIQFCDLKIFCRIFKDLLKILILKDLQQDLKDPEKIFTRVRQSLLAMNVITNWRESVMQCSLCTQFYRVHPRQPMIMQDIPARIWSKLGPVWE